MEFMEIKKNDLRILLNNFYLRDLEPIFNYIINNFEKEDIKALGLPNTIYDKTKHYKLNKTFIVNLLIQIKESSYFTQCFYNVLNKNKASNYIYEQLIWKMNYLDSQELNKQIDIKLKEIKEIGYYHKDYMLDNELALVERCIYHTYSSKKDILKLNNNIDKLLKLFYPIPHDYHLQAITVASDTKYHYNNEDGVLLFIQSIEEMLNNRLIEFGKTNEKPMVKSLNLLKSSNLIEDFYQEKKINLLALDMLTRSFYYYQTRFEFKSKPLDTLKLYMEQQLKSGFKFTISRLFTSHLKKVRFGKYQNEEKELFDIFKHLMRHMPTEGWVAFENILNYTYYRELYFDFEDTYRTQGYEFVSNQKNNYGDENKILEVGDHHAELFHEPVLKGIFFYMASLGLVELKYNDPISPYEEIKAKDKPYISVWDGLQYAKLTKLGAYIFEHTSSYIPKMIKLKKTTKVRFDEFKPIITVDKTDVLFIAKLEAYTDKLDDEHYILSYTKLFRGCKSLKELKVKIEDFYTKIEKNPPKVFKEFFEEVFENANPMKRNLKQVVIELKNNKKLLNLFISNHKLQELFIKAEGYRIIVFKEDIPKVTKIVKENGFFLEF